LLTTPYGQFSSISTLLPLNDGGGFSWPGGESISVQEQDASKKDYWLRAPAGSDAPF